MADLSVSGITGTDGKTPIYEPEARWTSWALQDLYLGGSAAKKYVPKVNDYVIDYETNEKFIVTDVDPTTLIPTMRPIKEAVADTSLDELELLMGVGPGTQSDTYRVYIDRSKVPHVLAVDARLRVAGSMTTSCKIFKGSSLQGNEHVISALYDANGVLLGQAIPLELALVPNDATNHSIKVVPVCYTTEELLDNEVVTAVFYSDTGHVVSKRQLLVENTGFIRSSNDAVKYVTGITLESPFMSTSDPLLLSYPINVPTNALNLMGVVHYSDGSQLRMPVDGTKFQTMGLEGFVATIVGQKAPFVIKYNLSPGEIGYGETINAERFITKQYRAQTTRADGIYSVKLFAYPVWIDAVSGYRLEWYLYNLDRDVVYRATPYVQINVRPFDPLAYGISQRLSVSVNLKTINAAFKNYVHTQVIDIALNHAGDQQTSVPWSIGFEPGQNPQYQGTPVAMTYVNANLRRLRLGEGFASLDAWLQEYYYPSLPLVDIATEALPPVPNFFTLVIGATELQFPIAQWNQEIPISQVLNNNDTLLIKFFQRTVENDIQLAIAGAPVWQAS